MEEVSVVDEDDTVQETIARANRTEEDVLRCALILLHNPQGEVLLQKRAASEENYPGYWDVSAGGTVQAGETYEEAAKRETVEELGVTPELTSQGKELFTYPSGKQNMLAVFTGSCESDLDLGEEVDAARFFTLEEAARLLEAGDAVHPEARFILKEYGDLPVARQNL